MNARVATQPLAELIGIDGTIMTGETAVDLLARLDYLDGARDATPDRAALLRATPRLAALGIPINGLVHS
jgi:hypothetical protein